MLSWPLFLLTPFLDVASTSPPNSRGFVSTSVSSNNSAITDYEVEVVEIRVQEGELKNIIPWVLFCAPCSPHSISFSNSYQSFNHHRCLVCPLPSFFPAYHHTFICHKWSFSSLLGCFVLFSLSSLSPYTHYTILLQMFSFTLFLSLVPAPPLLLTSFTVCVTWGLYIVFASFDIKLVFMINVDESFCVYFFGLEISQKRGIWPACHEL